MVEEGQENTRGWLGTSTDLWSRPIEMRPRKGCIMEESQYLTNKPRAFWTGNEVPQKGFEARQDESVADYVNGLLTITPSLVVPIFNGPKLLQCNTSPSNEL